MRYFPTGQMMKEGDNKTIQMIGMPSMVLMERAALESVDILEREGVDLSHVLIVCGSGNNGGDGLAIARILHLKNINVAVLFLGNEASATQETRQQMGILKNYGLSIDNTLGNQEYSTIIDCLFGIGLARDISGHYFEIIDTLNHMSGKKIAIDIPSGVSATTGKVQGIAFRADLTIALAFEKLGMVLYPGCQYTGKTVVADIGITSSVFENEKDIFYTYERKTLASCLPVRRADSHKGSHGKVLMIVGSVGMSGAAYLSARAAYTAGAGLVQIYTHEENRIILQQQLPEALVTTYTSYEEATLNELLSWADVTAIGAGLGQGDVAGKLLAKTLKGSRGPCVIDGDGLNLLSKHPEWLNKLNNGPYIITPHMKEMCRLLGYSMEELKAHKTDVLAGLLNRDNLTCVLKDARTMVFAKNEKRYLNISGNSAMAKGGSGDILLGIIAGFAVQKLSGYQAACAGVQIHGMAGDLAKGKKGSYSVLASDIIDHISDVLKELEEGIEDE